jgi:hypothetical protein
MMTRPTAFHAVLPAILALALAQPASSEPNRVGFPDNLDALEHYTTVTRGEVTEFIYTSRAALDAIKAGEPVPPGTQVILQDWRNGEVYRLFVMQNGEGWGEEYGEATRTGDWQFQWLLARWQHQHGREYRALPRLPSVARGPGIHVHPWRRPEI